MKWLTMQQVKDLYPLVYEQALKAFKAEGKEPSSYLRQGVDMAFDWSRTAQGHNFWSAIYSNNISEPRKNFPQYFEKVFTNGIIVTNNGLLC